MSIALFAAGCSGSELEYDANLGYDFNDVEYEDITFNIYHINPEDNSWEKIANSVCDFNPGEYVDVEVTGKTNKVVIDVEYNTYTKGDDGKSVEYGCSGTTTFEYDIDGFDGFIAGSRTYQIENKEGEQLVKLYPIANSNSVHFLEEDIDLSEPYDTEGETIDNILITVEMH